LEVVGATNISSTSTFWELTPAAVVLQWPEIPCLDLVAGIRCVEKGGPPVYRIVVPFVVLLLLFGCKAGSTTSGKPAASTGKGTDSGSTNTATQTATNTTSTDKQDKLYDGHTLEQWRQQLMDEKDQAVSDNAAFVLEKIGAEQLPYLVKAMNGKKDYIRLNVLDILNAGKEWAKKEGNTLTALLNKALQDDSAKVRRKASEVIAVLQFPDSVAALRKAAAKEEDPKTKQTMEENLAKIK
jgi:hypothetical protein